jgi:hypothetical protein
MYCRLTPAVELPYADPAVMPHAGLLLLVPGGVLAGGVGIILPFFSW